MAPSSNPTVTLAVSADGSAFAMALHRVVWCLAAETKPNRRKQARSSLMTAHSPSVALPSAGAASSNSTHNRIRPHGVWAVAGSLAVAGLALAGVLTWQAATGSESGASSSALQAQPAGQAAGTKAAAAKPRATAQAAVCGTCGVIEAVQAVKRKGEGTGLGAVVGGVAGAALGNQVGGGNGRKAMTVIGAVGGGVAGHEIEKHARATTVYEVRVRMDDGSVRTLERSSAPPVGRRVRMEGKAMTLLPARG
jgi:outer membrane lipoprotein SlyB